MSVQINNYVDCISSSLFHVCELRKFENLSRNTADLNDSFSYNLQMNVVCVKL